MVLRCPQSPWRQLWKDKAGRGHWPLPGPSVSIVFRAFLQTTAGAWGCPAHCSSLSPEAGSWSQLETSPPFPGEHWSSCLALATAWPERALPQKLFLWEIAKEHRQMFTSVSQELLLYFHTLAKPTSTQGASSGLFPRAVTAWVRVCIPCLISGWMACCPPTHR